VVCCVCMLTLSRAVLCGVLCQCLDCPGMILWSGVVCCVCLCRVHVLIVSVCLPPHLLCLMLQPPASLYTHMSAPPSYMYGSRSRHYPMSLDYPPPQPLPPHSRSSRAAVDKRSVVSFTSASTCSCNL